MAAMSLGKHVYVQKPLATTVRETRMLAAAAREKRLVSQMGIQISSHPTQLATEQMIRSGVIGKITEVHTFCDKTWGDMSPIPAGSDPVPESLDWDLWLGVSEKRPYKKDVVPPGQLAQAGRLRHRHARRHGLPHLQHAHSRREPVPADRR